MARLTPKLLLRGFEIFLLASLVGFGVTLWYGNNIPAFLAGITRLQWWWLLAGLGLASMDWIGGGLRLWVLARVLYPEPPLKGLILAGGMSAWAAYITPLQSGAAPMMVYTQRRFGVPVPVALATTLMSFIATVVFFAIAGPMAVLFGAGQALSFKGNFLGLSLYDLFLGSLGLFGGLGVLMIVVIVFPRHIRDLLHRIAEWIGGRHGGVASRLERLRTVIDGAHESVEKFNSPQGWRALAWATLLSGPSHANKLLAGYVTLRTLGIEAQFVDVLLLQTLITFLLYFAPTPGASGIAEVLSALIMTAYVPKVLTPLYIVIWRLILSYYTLGFGFLIFSGWVRRGLREISDAPAPVPPVPA